MIQSYRDKRTARFAAGERVKAFAGFARQAEKALDRLDAAGTLGDLAALPGDRLEALLGNRAGQYSIRINTSGAFALNGLTVPEGRNLLKSLIITKLERGFHGANSHPSRRTLER